MAKLVEQGMSEGALGLSSGLEYDVASYSSTDEMVAVAAAAAKHGGFYMTHVRDEADRSFEALEEEIAIGQRARIPVQHSHIKLGTVSVWGKAAEYVRVIEDARRNGLDFLADCYPYDAWYSTIKVLVPDKQYESPSSVKEALAAVGGAGNVTIANFAPNKRYEQQTIEQLAQSEQHRSDRHVHSDHPRGQRGERRRVDHRQVDDGCRHRAVLQTALGDGRERRRHRQPASARRGHVSARARAFRAREALAHAARGRSQDDFAAGAATGLARPRHAAQRNLCRPGVVRSRDRHRPRHVRASRSSCRSASRLSSSTARRCGARIDRPARSQAGY